MIWNLQRIFLKLFNRCCVIVVSFAMKVLKSFIKYDSHEEIVRYILILLYTILFSCETFRVFHVHVLTDNELYFIVCQQKHPQIFSSVRAGNIMVTHDEIKMFDFTYLLKIP